MQTTILKKDFINALTIGGAMAGKNKTLPILEFAKVEVSADTLAVHSFNGESWVTKRVSLAEPNGEYAFCINHNELVKALKLLAEEVVTFAIEGTTLVINHFKGTMEMPILQAEQFPMAQVTKEGTTLTLDADTLKTWLGIVGDFTAEDDLRPVMNGMYLYAREGRLGVCATDAHKMFTDSVEGDYGEFGVIVPSSAFRPLKDMLDTKELGVVIGDKNISFTSSDSELHCRLVEGNYPNFNAVIPRNNSVEVKASKSELLDSVNRASLMANKATSLLKLSVSDSVMEIEGSDIYFSKKAKESVKVEKSGADVVIGVKAMFFATCLGALDSEDVVLKMQDSQRAIVFEDALCKDKVVLVMPMMIQ